MSQNRVGLTFEALIHENKKRPNNRLQKMLNQKLQNLDSMKNESERMHRKTKSDLMLRQRIYSRILGSLSRDLASRAISNSRADINSGKSNCRKGQRSRYPAYSLPQIPVPLSLKNEETEVWENEEVGDDKDGELERMITLTELTVSVERPRLENTNIASSTGASQTKLPSIDES